MNKNWNKNNIFKDFFWSSSEGIQAFSCFEGPYYEPKEINTDHQLDCLTTTPKSFQSCLTLCDPIDGSPLGPAVPGILQARTLEWVAISSSNAWKWKVKVKLLSHIWLFATPWTAAYQAPPSMGFSRQEYLWPRNPTAGHTHRGNQNWKRHVYPNVHRSTVL